MKPKEAVNQLIKYVWKNCTNITFEIKIKGSIYTYRMLLREESESWTEKFVRHYSRDSEFSEGFELKSIIVFAQIINFGDNEFGLYTDSNGKIYETNCDYTRGGPTSKPIVDNILDFTGAFKIQDLGQFSHHFKYCQPAIKICDIINEDRVVYIDIHGFLIENYENILKQVFEKSNIKLELQSFKYPDIEWNDKEKTHYPVEIKLNGKDFQFEIVKSNWFDFDFPIKLNSILKKLKINETIHIINDIYLDEIHGLVLLNNFEYKRFNKAQLIAENETPQNIN